MATGVPAVRDLRLVLPTLAVLAVAFVTTGIPPAASAAIGVVFTVTAIAATIWAVTTTAGGGMDRAALGVLAMTFALGAVGAGVQAARSHALQAHPLSGAVGERTGIDAVVTGFDRPIRGGGVRVMVRVDASGTGHTYRRAELGVIVLAREGWEGLAPGTRVRAVVRVLDPITPGGPPALRALTPPRIVAGPGWTGRTPASVRTRMRVVSERALDGELAALLPSFVLGDEGAVSQQTRDDFRAAGLAHLAAVSGANTTYVVGAVLVLAAVAGAGRRGRVVAAALGLGGFVAVVGPEPAVLRAAGTGAIGLAALGSRRTGRPLAALAAVVLLVTLLDPTTATGAGFVLSVTATAALVVAARPATLRLRGWGLPAIVADVVAVCVIAHMATLPVLLVAGLGSGPWALAANIAVAPVVPVVTVLGTAAAALGPLWEGGAVLLARACGPALWWLETVASVTASLPGSPTPAGAVSGGR